MSVTSCNTTTTAISFKCLNSSVGRGCALAAGQVMAERAGRDGGSARHRRDRQFRAWHRHVRTTVPMELATAIHHSAQRVEGPREEKVHGTDTALRTEATSSVEAAGASCGGGWAAGSGSHGRLRGCQGSSLWGAVSCRPRCLLPPEGCAQEGGGGGGSRAVGPQALRRWLLLDAGEGRGRRSFLVRLPSHACAVRT